MNAGAAFANLAWLVASLPEYRRFRRDAHQLEATQRKQLKHYLQRNADTAFGLQHDFSKIDSWEEYSERVPLRDYDDFEPWISRIAAGEQHVLSADPVRLFEPSSGSSGPAKLIPYTQSLQREFRQGVAAWSANNFLSYPSLLAGRAYWSLTPQMRVTDIAESVVPIGFDEDSAYLGGFTQRLINRTFATHSNLRHVSDMETFWRVTLLLLLQCPDLRLVSVWHPSYLALLIEHMRGNWSSLLEDLESGYALTDPAIKIRRNPARARALELSGYDDLHRIWPKLKLISCWADGHADALIPQLQALFPDATLQAKGLVATEAMVTIPLGTRRPLAIRSHVFEFLDDDGNSYPSWHIEKGKDYTVVVTTGGGLYRYRLGDRVRVNDFLADVPSLIFLGKEDQVSDFYGEKLSENFVADVFRDAFAQFGLVPQFALLAVEESFETPAYVLYVESEDALPESLAERIDEGLRANPHYDLCIRLGQLGRTRIAQVQNNAFDLYTRRLLEMGMRIGDIKPTPLSRHSGWHRCLISSR